MSDLKAAEQDALASRGPSSNAEAEPRMAGFVATVVSLDNAAMVELGEFMAAQSPAYRARLIERCASMISSVAERSAA